MKNWKKAGISTAAVLVTFGAAVNLSPVVANAMDTIPVVGSIAKVVTLPSRQMKTDNKEADIVIPQLEQVSDVNKDILRYIDDLVAEYDKAVAKNPNGGQYRVHSDYEVVTDTAKYLSLRINTEVLEAGGEQRVKIFTVDKSTGKAVSLLDYLGSKEKLDTASKEILKQMKTEMAADDTKTYFTADDEMGDGFKGLSGKENFYIDKNGKTVIVFGEYEVAPGSMGVVSFTLAE